jgi:phosphate-selective porin OprO/OprP
VSKGGPGAWEVAVRYQTLDNTDAPLGGKGSEAEVGLNWRLEDWLRLMVNLSHWEVMNRAGPYAGTDEGDSLAGRLQIVF